MQILYVSHCAPDQPDKGDKIRAHHFVRRLAKEFDLHLVCFARSESEMEDVRKLSECCASVHVELHRHGAALIRAGVHFATGDSLTGCYYRSASMHAHIESALSRRQIAAGMAYSAVMGAYVPAQVPLVLDLCDLDSEKWFHYARTRHPGTLYEWEARRLRRIEQKEGRRAFRTLVMTGNEARLAAEALPGIRPEVVSNGVDFDYWKPMGTSAGEEGVRRLVFVGQMDYHPNVDAALWFARDVFPNLRAKLPDVEFVVAGRNPSAPVRRLQEYPGITVVPNPPDVRPLVESAAAVVVPIRLARGLQNKVLEALAMGKTVFTTPEVGRTFGDAVPPGVEICGDAKDLVNSISNAIPAAVSFDPRTRAWVSDNYCWNAAVVRVADILREAALRR